MICICAQGIQTKKRALIFTQQHSMNFATSYLKEMKLND